MHDGHVYPSTIFYSCRRHNVFDLDFHSFLDLDLYSYTTVYPIRFVLFLYLDAQPLAQPLSWPLAQASSSASISSL